MGRIISYGLAFVVYLLFQVLFFNHIILFKIATPHIFVLFVIFLPLDMSRILEFFVAFLAGLFLDLLSDGSV
ncbi:MAG: rod shape-determining protein MreD, partial [Bacteroidota bacterium]